MPNLSGLGAGVRSFLQKGLSQNLISDSYKPVRQFFLKRAQRASPKGLLPFKQGRIKFEKIFFE
jgi:hypothetical protein